MKFLYALLILAACTTLPPERVETPVVLAPVEILAPKFGETVEVITPKYTKVPNYVLASDTPEEFREAIFLIAKFGNTDEFWNFVLSKRTKFSHTPLDVKEAVRFFRMNLHQGDTIPVEMYSSWYPSKAIGGWTGTKIVENRKKQLGLYRRAGHLLHETTHKYNFKHNGNYSDRYDNENSFPYAVGYDFEEFLLTKKEQLATK